MFEMQRFSAITPVRVCFREALISTDVVSRFQIYATPSRAGARVGCVHNRQKTSAPARFHTALIRKVASGEFKNLDQVRAACSGIKEAAA